MHVSISQAYNRERERRSSDSQGEREKILRSSLASLSLSL
jgi:hypothetical protein